MRRHLVVGAANDQAERDADAAARAAMARLRSGAIGRATATAFGESDGRIRRVAEGSIGAAGGAVDADTQRSIDGARGAGASLPATLRRDLGAGFGRDVGEVRIHTGGQADQLNRRLNARAFTTGRDVFFARGEYRPDTETGQQVIAHEVAHTMQQGGSAARQIRRWDIAAPLDLDDAHRVATIKGTQAVFFLDDLTGDKLVVKADDVPVGMSQLFATVLGQVSKTSSIRTARLAGGEKAKLRRLIADDAKTAADASWNALYNRDPQAVDDVVDGATPDTLALFGGAAPAAPEDKARLFRVEQLSGPAPIIAMTMASGKAVEEQAKAGAGTAGRTSRHLFGDPAHMEQLGVITAADLFVGNTDRVYSGNLGNWFVDAAGAITLIDNIDGMAAHYMRSGTVHDAGGDSTIQHLAQGNLARTARDTVDALIQGMVRAGDTTANDWATSMLKGVQRRVLLERAFVRGLKRGRERIVHIYATGKKGTRGRAAKAAATATQGGDVGAGMAAPATDYWETLKARARWIKAH